MVTQAQRHVLERTGVAACHDEETLRFLVHGLPTASSLRKRDGVSILVFVLAKLEEHPIGEES